MPRNHELLRLAAILFTIAALAPAVRADDAAKSATPLIPRNLLFDNPDRASPQVSPDGKKLAFLSAVDGVLNIWVGPLDKPDTAKPLTHDTGRPIRQYFWAFDNAHILYLQDNGGDENWRVYSVDAATGTRRDLTPFDSIPGPDGKPLAGPDGKKLAPAARIEGVSHRLPTEILIGLNNRMASLHDIYRVNIVTGKLILVKENKGFSGYVADDDFNVRLAHRLTSDGGAEFLKADGKGGWTDCLKIGKEDAMQTQPESFDKSGKTLYLMDSRGRDTAAVVAIDMDAKDAAPKVIADDPRADAGQIITHPTEKTIQAVSFDYDRRAWKVIDQSIEADLAALRKVADGDLAIASRSLDDHVWIVSYVMDNGPVRFYRYDRPAKKATFLFTNRKSLEGLTLAKMRPTIIKSRDGFDLVCYYSLPPWTDSDGDAKPDKPLPMVLLVHGGPWGRDSWGFNGLHQLLANRGYAVLSVNFRSSTGLGKKFTNAGNMEWAGKMHDDLLDAVDWAVKEKIAEPAKIAIMGGSYGGYATLVGLTFTPDTFACGVDIVGPSNIVTLLNSIPEYWKPMIELFTSRVGDHRTEAGRKFLTERSPLTRADKIKKPLLIGQGANDPRVKQAEADQIVKAMQDKNIPVTYVLFPDEGHGFARPPNNIAFYSIIEQFLAKHLGGRAEPIGDAFKGSSITVPAGAAGVPGLNDALQRVSPRR